mgnify:CR=1 FL=1
MHAHAPEATPRPEMSVRPRESSVVLVLDLEVEVLLMDSVVSATKEQDVVLVDMVLVVDPMVKRKSFIKIFYIFVCFAQSKK